MIFCGTAAGTESAKTGSYYAGSGNRFWQVLHETGLTPRRLEPSDWPTLPNYGIGLTDLAKHAAGPDSGLSAGDLNPEALANALNQWTPRALAFNGKKAAETFYGHAVGYGKQANTTGSTAVFVLPSTSGMASKFWDQSHWDALAAFVAA